MFLLGISLKYMQLFHFSNICIAKMKELILLFGIGCLTWPSALGHAVPRNVENMNGLYLISNPNHATQNSYSTLYSDRPNVEYFDAYSPPISTR